MTITRANAEVILIRRCGKLMTEADMNGLVNYGTNEDLNDPIGWALRKSGYSVATITNVADGDMAAVSDDDVDMVLDLAELRTLENIEGNLTGVDITVGPRSEKLDQLVTRVRAKIERKSADIAKAYGLGLGTLSAGVITLDFQEHADDDTE
jgi:hypothetical protein